jgi:hypothetical protein
MIANNQIIARMQFGSHVYGTNVPTSDQDFKSVFIPDAYELIMQRPAKHILNNTKTNSRERNTAEDIDDESFSVQRFLQLINEGQTVSLDILWTPKEFYSVFTPEWQRILDHRSQLIHRGTSAFIGYTKQQAAKYGLKGFRVALIRQTLEWLKSFPNDRAKLIQIGEAEIQKFVDSTENPENAKVVIVKAPNGLDEPHLSICNRKIPFHATINYATEVFQRIFDNYGQRALQAERNENVDWKACMHAVRVAREAEELLLTGNVTFPRPEKDLLLKIRKGEMTYKECEAIIEEGLIKINEAEAKSTLRAEPNHKLTERLVYEFHSMAIDGRVK